MKNGLAKENAETRYSLWVFLSVFLSFFIFIFLVSLYLHDFITHLKICLTLVHPTDGHIRAGNIAVG